MSPSRIWMTCQSAAAIALACLGGCEKAAPPDKQLSGQQATPAVFVEVAQETGLAFQHFLGATGQYYFPETTASGVALLDYDNDGDLDVYLLQGAMLEPGKAPRDSTFPPSADYRPGNRLFRNELVPDGRLRFIDVTESAGVGHDGYGMGAATGDFDNDGDTDLYVTNFGPNVFYRNNGDGSFTDITATTGTDDPRWSTSAAFLDYDHDGDLDLFLANYVVFTVSDHKRCAGKVGAHDYCGPTTYLPVPDRLFRNDGNGAFTDISREAGISRTFGPGLGVVCADLDADGWTDIYVANDGQPNQLWHNNRDGTFTDRGLMSGSAVNAFGVAEASMGVTAGDIDGDGDDDLFMSHLRNETNTLYLNDGQGNFDDVTDRFGLGAASRPFTGFGAQWFDYDNDGQLDLFIANGAVTAEPSQVDKSGFPYAQKNQLFRNLGGLRFEDVGDQAGPALALVETSRGAAFGDLDNDGDVDIVVSNANGPVRLLRNEIGNRQHWLGVRLQGVAANRDGAGARVAVLRRGKAPVWRRAGTDGSYLSASDGRVHFGLGEDAALEGVGVQWPGGQRERWAVSGVDQWLTLREGSGIPWPEKL